MMTVNFTDAEYAVMLDSLNAMRNNLRARNIETPNVDSAISKMCTWGDPSGCEFTVTARRPVMHTAHDPQGVPPNEPG